MPEVSRPPVPNLKVPFDSKGYTHTRLPEGRRVWPPSCPERRRAHVHAKGTDENEKDETDKGVCGCR